MFASSTMLSSSFLIICLLSSAAYGALQRVTDFGANPTNLEMNIWVPSQLATNPAVILALHFCSGTGQMYAQQTKYSQLSDQKGFIVIFPTTKTDSNCWDNHSTKSLRRDGGGDTTGLANMIKYTISKYNADPSKVFVTGSSSGGMMTNTLCATYPDLFAAASVYSGVPAGCLAGSPGSSPFSADPACANGQKIKTQKEWADLVKGMYPGYSGRYPRMITWHGTADGLVTYPNFGEQIKQWTGIHGLQFTKNNTNTPQSGYTQMVYGDGTIFAAYSAQGVGHTVPVHEDVDLKFFGI